MQIVAEEHQQDACSRTLALNVPLPLCSFQLTVDSWGLVEDAGEVSL